MIKTKWYLAFVLLLSLLINNALAKQITQNEWDCSIDLENGDVGTLFLVQTENKVKGGIKVFRNTDSLLYDVKGIWAGRSLSINRAAGSARKYAMDAIMIRSSRKRLHLGGRFGLDYRGIWSGECLLTSSKNIQVPGRDTNVEATPDKPQIKAGPSTSVRATPYNPTTNDSVKFSATASHPDGVKSISIILDDRVIKTCRSRRCSIVTRPLSKGKHIWRVEAVSRSGFKNPKYSKDLIVKKALEVGQCLIKGKASGRPVSVTNNFSVHAYGPNNDSKFRVSARIKNGRYQLKKLPEGNYRLFVDERGDSPIRVSPSPITVRCSKSGTVTQNFEFQ